MKRLLKIFRNELHKSDLWSAFIKTLSHFKDGRNQGIEIFRSPKLLISADIRKDIKDKYNFDGELLDIFLNNKKNIVHKWHHYIPLYDKYFDIFRNRQIRFLEIGVSKGGSLQMWRQYFGDQAIIFGIDINPECYKYNGHSAQVRIGSQVDENFLMSVVSEMGGIDIVLDDGSHRMEHIEASLNILFPKLNNSGIYLIEDLHTSYWKDFGGGFDKKSNFFNKIRNFIDDIHHWYHPLGYDDNSIGSFCSAIHIHDSIVVLEKNITHRPLHSEIS